MKQRTGKKLLGFLLTLTFALGLMAGMSVTAYAADSTVSNEADLRSALSASESGTVTLGNNIVISTGLSSIGTKILDLNGYGILMTGNERVITANGNLTINDSDTTKAHAVTLVNYRGTAVADGTGITSVTNGTGTVYIKGGYLTGGNTEWGSAIVLNGDLTINGGTILGTTSNTSGAIRVNGGHVLTLNGGQIIYNRGASAADNGGAVNEEANGMIRFSGNPVVEHNYDANGRARNVNIRSNITTMPKVIAPLKDGAEIGITMQNLAGVFISGDNTDYNDPSKFFMDRATSYSEITRNSSGQLEIKIITDPAHYKVDGNTITLMDTTGWDIFCDLLESNANGYYTGKTVVMGDSFTITRMAGNDAHRFTGTFDGNKKTLTIDITRNENSCAPFSHVENATIKDLKVEGTLTTNQKFAAGIAAFTYGTTNITDCLSSVTIKSSISGDGTHGGFVGVNESGGNLTMTGCVFNGSMLGENTGYCGGFVGWTTAAIKFTDCLFDPGTLTIQAGGGGTFQRNSMSSTFANAYYMKAYGSGYTGQGKQAYSITHGDDVEIDFGTPVKEYSVSGITSYATGIGYADTFYAGSSEEISMTLNYRGPSEVLGYTVTLNDGRLIMPAQNVVISAITAPVARVNYGQTTTEYIVFSEAVSAWNSAESGAALTLLADVTTANTISVTGTKTLDLNGYGIKMAGSGRVLNVSGGANLTLEDSTPDSTHKYTIASPKSNGAGLAVVDDRNGSTEFTGGYITGGNVSNEKGGGIQVNGGSLTMTGGTVIGNRVEGTVHGGGIAVIGESDTFKMTGGSIIGNTARYGGGLSLMSSSSGTISGGVIKYNYTTRNGGGIHTDNSPTLTITGGMIVNNYTDGEDGGDGGRGGGIIVDNGKGINLSGNPTIEGNQKDGVVENIYLRKNYKINITGELSNNTSIGISMQNIGVFTNSTGTDYNVASKFTSDNKNYEIRKNDGGQLYLYALPAASVTNGKTTTEYGTLSEAVSAWNNASSGATLTLLGNVGTDSVISVSGVKNLDLNGKTLTLSKEYAITVGSGSNLTIGGDGNIKNSVNAHFIKVDGGTLTVDGPVMQSAMGGINVTNHGTLYFKSGSMMLDNGTVVNVEGGSTANLYDGTFRSTQHLCGYANGSGSNINISGGIFKGARLLQPNGGTITVSGGYFTDKISTCGATIATGYAIVGSDDQDKGTKMVVPLQTISAENVAVTYGDADKKVDASVTVPQTGGGAISYAVNNGSERFIEVNATTGALTIRKVPATGTAYVTVTAAATDGFAKTTKEVTVTISKAEVTVTAKNQSIYVKGTVPDLSEPVLNTHYTVTGLVGEDMLTTGPSLAYQKNGIVVNPDNTVADTYDIVASGATASDNYTITHTNGTLTINNKGTQIITAEDVTATYGDTDKKVDASVTVPETGGGAISYAVKDGSSEYIEVNATTGALTIKKVPADGKAYVTVTAAETATYTQATKEVTVTINRADAVPATVTANNRTYDGTEEPLVNVNDSTLVGGKMSYALGTDATTAPTKGWNAAVPAAINSQTYYVWYKVVGDDNYKDTEPAYVEAKINPVDKTDLNNAIGNATPLYDSIKDKEIYNKAATALKTVIDAAQKVAVDDNADVTKVNSAITAVNNAKTDAEAEKAVIDIINALPKPEEVDYTKIEYASKFEAAREAYDKLTAAQKAIVKESNLAKLEACENALVNSFYNEITTTGQINANNRNKVATLLDSYDRLTDSYKAAVDKKIGRAGTKKLSDLEEALDVTDRIYALKPVGDIELSDEKTIKYARTAYELLSDSQKAMISEETLAKLAGAETRLEELKGQDALAAVKASAIERLEDYAEAKALADFSEAEKIAYNAVVGAEEAKINAARTQDDVATALTDAKAAVDEALKDITDARAAAAEEAAAQAAADQAIKDAKASADVAKEEADKAVKDKYASDEDKTAINNAKEVLDTKIKAATDLPATATAKNKEDAAQAIEDAVKALNEAVDTANLNSAKAKAAAEAEADAKAQLAAAKKSAVERLKDYAGAKALSDATPEEKSDYNTAVTNGEAAINEAITKEAVAEELTKAKKAVDAALAKIKSDRAEAAAAAEKMAAANKALEDAKTSADAAKEAAKTAIDDTYASDTDRQAIRDANTELDTAILAAAGLPDDATAEEKNAAAEAIMEAVKNLETATDTANVNSDARRKAEEEAATEAEQLAAAKTSAIARLTDYSEAKALADATADEKAAYEQAVADGISIINAVENKEAVAAALTDAKGKVNDALAGIERARAEAAAEAAAQAEADKGIADAKTTAEEAKAAADAAAGDKYASEADKKAIGEAETKLNNAIQAATELGKDATVADKEKAAADIKTATEELNSVTNTAIINSEYAKAAATEAAQLMAAKTSAKERLDDYSEAKALKDATPEEKAAYDKAVADGRKAIEDAADQDAVAQALKDAKAAVDAVLAEIKNARAEAAAEAAARAAADKAVTDAKEAAKDAAAAADRAAADEYASEDDKKAISDAKTALEKAVGDADKLPAGATTEQKYAAAKAIEDAVKELNAATDKANIDSAAARAAAGEAETEAEKLARAKEAAIGRLEDYSELKALADATEDEKKYYDGVVAAEKEKINAAADQSAVTTALTAAKEAVNAAIEKIKKDRGDASTAEAVTAAINALPAKDKITEDDRAAIEAARAAYEALSADQKALVTADTIKKLKDAEDQLVILKAMSEVSAKTGSDVICTGEPIILVNGPVTALPEGYTMQYALGTDAAAEPAASAYSTSIPTGTEAGTYYVWYKVRGEGDRGDSKARVVSVSLIKDDSEVLEEDIPEGGIPEGIWIAGVRDLEYTGKALTQEFRLYDGNKRLIEKKDYTVSYKNNTKVYTVRDPKKLTAEDEKNAPSIIIRMKGNYGDVEPAYFNIKAIDISKEGFSVSDMSAAYNGNKQTPAPVLTWNGKKLKAGTDFTVKEYIEKKDDRNAFKGQADKTTVYDLTVIGIGNFTGSRDIKLTIAGKTERSEGKEVPVVLMKDVKTPSIPEQKYTGEEYTIDALKDRKGAKLAFTVLYKSKVLTEGKDYEAEFTDARDAGTATLILRGLCSTDSDTGFCFAGEKRITFKIAGLQVSKASVGGIAKSYAYTGNEITPAVTLTIDGKAVPAEDYSVTYEKNVKVGTATAVITGHNSCQGTKKVNFRINPYDMSTDRGAIVINEGEAIETEYVKGGAQPKISVTFNGKKLFEGGDYTVKFSNNDKVAGARYVDAPTVTITGKGSFKGSKGVNFTIRQRKFTEGNGLTLLAPDVNEGSKIGSAKIKILDSNGKELKAGTDYEKNIKYTDMSTGKEISADTKPAAGMRLKVEVKGTGLYTSDTLAGEMRVIDKTRNISKAKIKIAAQKYTGREVKITDKSQFTTATIKIDGQERGLILGEDFEIVEGSYINNVNKGTAKVTIHGLEGGRYALGGYKTVTFKIVTRSISEWWKGIFSNL